MVLVPVPSVPSPTAPTPRPENPSQQEEEYQESEDPTERKEERIIPHEWEVSTPHRPENVEYRRHPRHNDIILCQVGSCVCNYRFIISWVSVFSGLILEGPGHLVELVLRDLSPSVSNAKYVVLVPVPSVPSPTAPTPRPEDPSQQEEEYQESEDPTERKEERVIPHERKVTRPIGLRT